MKSVYFFRNETVRLPSSAPSEHKVEIVEWSAGNSNLRRFNVHKNQIVGVSELTLSSERESRAFFSDIQTAYFFFMPSQRELTQLRPETVIHLMCDEASDDERFEFWRMAEENGFVELHLTGDNPRGYWKRNPQRPLFVSLVLPIYNVAKFLPLCLNRLTKSPGFYYQIICVNDGSTDNSAEVVEAFAAKDPRIRLVTKPNGGCASARQHGLDIAKSLSDYVIFVDPDDFTTGNYIARLSQDVLLQEVDVAQVSYAEYYEDSGKSRPVNEDHLIGFRDGHLPLVRDVAIWRCIFSVAYLEKHGISFPVHIRRFDDLPFAYDVFARKPRFKHSADIHYFYRLGRAGQDISFSDQRLLTCFDLYSYLGTRGFGNTPQCALGLLVAEARTHRWAISKIDPGLLPSYVFRSFARIGRPRTLKQVIKNPRVFATYLRSAVAPIVKATALRLVAPRQNSNRRANRPNAVPTVQIAVSESLTRLLAAAPKLPFANLFDKKSVILTTIPRRDIQSFMPILPELLNGELTHPYEGNLPAKADAVAIWGIKPTGPHRILAEYSVRTGTPLIYVEDGLIRSIFNHNHASKDSRLKAGISFLTDNQTPYYDNFAPSQLEQILNSDWRLKDEEKLRIQQFLATLKKNQITKYNFQTLQDYTWKATGRKRVLLIQQTPGDMSLIRGRVSEDYLNQMILEADRRFPDYDIVIKAHPDVLNAGFKKELEESSLGNRIQWIAEAINPFVLFAEIDEVFVASSQLGFEAAIAGLPVTTFGAPFYAGWGFTRDMTQIERRERFRGIEEVAFAVYFLMTTYIDIDSHQRIEPEQALKNLIAQRDAYFETLSGQPMAPTEVL